MEDINVQIMDMDTMIPEHLVKNSDDTYTIFLNAKLSQEGRIKAYQHALSHIKNGDFEKSDIQNIELQAHELESPEKVIPPPPVDKYEKNIKRLQREKKRIQKALKAKEKEIDIILELYGPDYFFQAAENRWLYGD